MLVISSENGIFRAYQAWHFVCGTLPLRISDSFVAQKFKVTPQQVSVDSLFVSPGGGKGMRQATGVRYRGVGDSG